MQIQERLRVIRKDLKLNQSDFANKIGITQSHLSKLENGTLELSVSIIQSLYSALQVNPTWFTVGIGSMYISKAGSSNSDLCHNGINESFEIVVLKARLEEKEQFIKLLLDRQNIDFEANIVRAG